MYTEMPDTPEELQRLLQAEGDRRVTQALKTASEKWRRETLRRLERERREAERLVARSLVMCEKEALERYRRDIEEKERALLYKELEIRVLQLLAENKLPLEFTDLLLNGDEEATMRRAELLIRLWRDKLKEAVREAGPGTPVRGEKRTMEE